MDTNELNKKQVRIINIFHKLRNKNDWYNCHISGGLPHWCTKFIHKTEEEILKLRRDLLSYDECKVCLIIRKRNMNEYKIGKE